MCVRGGVYRNINTVKEVNGKTTLRVGVSI